MYVDKGTILEKGTHDELMAQKGEYYKLYMSQFADVSEEYWLLNLTLQVSVPAQDG